MKQKRTILLAGEIAGVPHQGGATWAVLQYLLGFRQLGHDVFFVEPVAPAALTPLGAALAESFNAAYFRQVIEEFDLATRAALLVAGTRETVGLPYAELRRIARRADLLVNISGLLSDPDLTAAIPIRVYLDLDPAFNQLWHAVEGIDRHFDGHTHHVTVGQAIGRPECPIPTCGRTWIPTVPPVVLSAWPVADRVEQPALTTIANWRGYGSIEYAGVLHGQKAHSVRQIITLPTLTDVVFRPAIDIHPAETADVAALAANGWRRLDPAAVAGTPASYQRFIQESWGEIGIAKSGYLVSRCGWFSDRSVGYLASGRPVLAQDTGFSRYLPIGEGLFAFTTVDDALAAIEALKADYPRQARAARDLAVDCFDSAKVLDRLLDEVGA